MSDSRLWHPFADMSVVRSREFVISRGWDVWVWDERGNRYLDATASLWYANVGHGRVEIATAVAAQLRQIEAYSSFGDYATQPALDLAARLCALAPGDGWRVFLAGGGGEAIDAAAKLARRYFAAVGAPGRQHFISRTHGYHGTNGWGTALAGIPANRDGFGELGHETTQVHHDSLEELATAFTSVGAERVAAVFVEPVIGAGGVHPPAPGYLKGVQELCRRHGALLVADSVIGGFGRLGSWFGVERFDITPDLIVFAKGVTSGYLPLGGVMVSAQVAEPFYRPGAPIFRHGSTYAAHATSCAAALANLDILEGEDLLGNSRAMERELFAVFDSLTDHELVAGARGGVGLLAAIELSPASGATPSDLVPRVFARAREHGVLVRPLATALAASPPLTVTERHLDLLKQSLRAALDDVAKELATHSPALAAG